MPINQLGISPNWKSFDDHFHQPLKNDELHVWWLRLVLNDNQKSVAYSLLSEKQLDKYNRRATPELKDAYLAGRYYLFTLLSRYANCKPNDVKLGYNRLNKPFLIAKQDEAQHNLVKFNFTDTTIGNHTYALYAFCRNKDVGVDLESCHRAADVERIAHRRFTQEELAYVTDIDGKINSQRCLSIWTRKEAYGKALGVGINFQMNQRNLVDAHEHDFIFNDDKSDWRLLQIQPTSQFIAAVVHAGSKKLTIKSFNTL